MPDRTGLKVLRAAAAPTSSYVAATLLSADEHNAIGLLISYVKGDETSIQIKVESTNDPVGSANPTWYQQVTATPTGGTTVLAPNEYSITAASVATSQGISIIVTPVKGTMYRISVKGTGGTPTGTVGISAILGWV